ncbi:penicillin-binding protein 1A [Cohnella hashimotonis]|uniref:Transglycosylase domain-containing protein n=1 Tax=Cohnella hashimotonis TaxID=2826895 RepID=A0ABT6TI07_9BACL|nr:penicillin-binding protein 1A [Cohnella hashimotonis]MDI4646468.1 transglycosylase domain-containing protein [Cohnella hashimotonis]
MSDTKQPSKKPKRKKRSPWVMAAKLFTYTILWLVFFAVLAGLAAGGAVGGYIAALVKDDPIRSRALIEEKINENNATGFVYFRDGTLIGQLRTEEDRQPITYDKIPQVIIDSVLSIEDKNFFNHVGVDTNGLFRAVKQQLLNEDVQTGGSTITQQLARRVFLSLDQTQSRKAKEIFLSLRLERFLGKEEILTAYLNKIPYGNGASGYQLYGIKAASKGIFGIEDLSKLNLAQAAYLAGLPQRPSAYSAFTGKGDFNEANFKRALARQKLVLQKMLEYGKINQQQYDEAIAFDIYGSLAKPTEKAYNTYPYLMLEVERQAAMQLVLQQNPTLTIDDLKKKENASLIEDAREQLLRGGYKITTTIDKKVYDTMHKVAEDPKNFSPDSKTKGVEQTAAVMLDHKTGAILGMIEGRDFHIEQLNFATQMERQPGSAMKPIGAYLPAIDKGLISPASILDDAPIILKNSGSSLHIPKNSNNRYSGLVTARYALNQSLNLPALKVFLDKVTIKGAWDFARQLGITTLVPEDDYAQTGVIGGLKYGVTVEELTNAYGAIANKGVFNDAYLIEKMKDSYGNIVIEHKAAPKRVVSEQSAYLMTDMLRTVVTDGTGKSVKNGFNNYGKIPIVGKTGTTSNYADVWFEGFTPDITLGVWAGYEKSVNTLSTDGHARAREIWTKVMNEVTEARPDLFPTKEFKKPEGIVSMTVSSVSGKLPTDLTRSAGKLVTDIFNKKYIPTEEDDALVAVKYISYNGVNYKPSPETPEDMLRESIMTKREKPLDALIEELKAALDKVPASSRKALSYYLPRDASGGAPSKPDPRVDDGSSPSAPGNITVEQLGGGKMRISFSKSPQADVVGYRLYRSVNGGSYVKTGSSVLTGEDTRFIDYSSSGSVRYAVTAVDVAGNESGRSESSSSGGGSTGGGTGGGGDGGNSSDPGDAGTPLDGQGNGQVDPVTNGGAPSNDPGQAQPAAPSGLAAQPSAGGVTLSWNANPDADKVSRYEVWYSASEKGNYRRVESTQSTQYELSGNNTAGWYRVRAVNDTGASDASPSVEVKNS